MPDLFGLASVSERNLWLIVVIGFISVVVLFVRIHSDNRKTVNELSILKQQQFDDKQNHELELKRKDLEAMEARDHTSGEIMRQMMTAIVGIPQALQEQAKQFTSALKEISTSTEDTNLLTRTALKQFQGQFETTNQHVTEGDRAILSRLDHYGSSIGQNLDRIPAEVWSQTSASQLVEFTAGTEKELRENKLKLSSIDNSIQYVDSTLSTLVTSIDDNGKKIMQIVEDQRKQIDDLRKRLDEATIRAEQAELRAQAAERERDELKKRIPTWPTSVTSEAPKAGDA